MDRETAMIGREDVDGVAVVRLAHGKVNALDLELLQAITATFRELDRADTTAIVLTGSGRAFSAGVDLWRIVNGGADYVRAFLPALSTAFLAVFTSGKPVVAAVNGHAIAGGAILACACDRRMMDDSGGQFGVTELRVGVPFPPVALEILGYAIGERAARDAVLGAGTVPPRDAYRRGYVDELVMAEDVTAAAIASARQLGSAVPADTYRFAKAQLRRPVEERLVRLRPELDPQVEALWLRGVEDGRIRRYMEQIARR
jgi:enoyl-CoA hydratase